MSAAGEKVCRGCCGRRLPLEAFRRNASAPDGRRATCRDCQAGRVPSERGPHAAIGDSGLAESYSSLRRDILDRKRRADDPTFLELAHEVEFRVRTSGPLVGDGLVIGWDWMGGAISVAARKSPPLDKV